MKFIINLILLLCTATNFTAGQQTNVDTIVIYDVCFEAMYTFDINKDRTITVDEYLGFVREFSGRTECLVAGEDLPLELRLMFNQLSCECRYRGGDTDCCVGANAAIPTGGVLPDDETTREQQNFLRQVCLRTDQAVITYCGPPPPPPPVVVPGAFPVAPAAMSSTAIGDEELIGIIVAAVILILLLLCCCCRRRWCFCAGKAHDDDSSESSSSDESSEGGGEGGVTRQVDEFAVDDPETQRSRETQEIEFADDDADAAKARAQANEEDEDDGQGRWNRTLQDPEYEDETDPRRRGPIELLPEDPDPEDGLALRHVEKPEKPPEPEDPYELEHYEPDGGIHSYERTGDWSYEADGGWTPEERAQKDPTEWNRKKYEREVKEEPEAVDNRKQRKIEALGGGEVFDQLEDEEDSVKAAKPDDMFDWVIRSTLNTLDQKGDQLQGSVHEPDNKRK